MSTGQQFEIVTADAPGRTARKYAVSDGAGGVRAAYGAAALLIYGFVTYLKDAAFGAPAKAALDEYVPDIPTGSARALAEAPLGEQSRTSEKPTQPHRADGSIEHQQSAPHTLSSRGALQPYEADLTAHSFGLGRAVVAPLETQLPIPMSANDNIASQAGLSALASHHDGGASAATKAVRAPRADGDRPDSDARSRNRVPSVSSTVMLDDLLVNTAIVISLADLLEHAADPDGDALHVMNVAASSGAIVNNGNETWTYTPDVNDTGAVTLSYTITDGEAGISQTAMIDLIDAAPKTFAGSDGDDTIAGTPSDDIVEALEGHDIIATYGGDDVVYAGPGNDSIHTGDGNDLIYAGDGNDIIFAGAGDDIVYAGGGDDVVSGDAGDDTLLGETGNDAISGGTGNDALFGGDGADDLIGDAGRDFIAGGDGNDRIIATNSDGNDICDGGDGTDTYDLSLLSSDVTIDLKAGTSDSAESGHDDLSNIENVICGSGDDTIVANEAQNVMTGGDGEDTFVFASIFDSGLSDTERDTINDFEVGDRIDVSKIDSDAKSDGQQKFEFKGDADHFEKAGELRYRFEDDDRGHHTLVFGNVNEDLGDDFVIELSGTIVLTSDDFIGLTQGLPLH